MVSRRDLVLTGLAAVATAGPAPAQPFRMRLSWPSFRASTDYPAYVLAIGRMRANANASSPASWSYWANMHEAHCPHGEPYFLAWHRGFLHLFELQLRAMTGVADFRLPYWDYYTDPGLPVEFLSGGPGHPLWAERVGASVAAALTIAPFDALQFQDGLADSFEAAIESQPHNPVHNLIGGVMVTMQSPQDPIFWLHHANVDRLWTAWTAAGQGRTMPPETSSYWSGSFAYAPGVSLPRILTRDGRASFGDAYESTGLPVAIPFVTARPPLRAGRAGAAQRLQAAPPPAAPRLLALAPGASLALGSQSFSVEAPVSGRLPMVGSAALSRRSARAGRLTAAPPPPAGAAGQAAIQATGRTVSVILDGVALTQLGKRGGYFYKVYLSPPHARQPEDGLLLGTLGAFEIAAARHHAAMATAGMTGMPRGPVRLAFPAGDRLKPLAGLDAASLVVSFVRIDGGGGQGDAITVDRFRIEASGG